MKSIIVTTVITLISLVRLSADTEWNKVAPGSPIEPDGKPTSAIINLSGIGVEISNKTGKCVIATVLKGSGAAAAGLKVEDIITHIDSKGISNLDLAEIAALLRGNPDSTVILTVQRSGSPKPQNYTVTRRPVRIQ